MKKFLVLALVLSVASLASAALSVSVTGDTTVGGTFYVTLSGVVGTDFGDYEMYDVFEGYGIGANAGDIVSANLVLNGGERAAGNLSAVIPYPSFDGLVVGFDETPDTNPANDAISGAWLTLEVLGAAEGIMQIGLESNGDYAAPDSILANVVVTPEPATMALLGLGALVLRRKK